MSEKKSKAGRNPKIDPAVFRYTVRFNEEEHNRFLSMFEKSGVYAKSVFIKAHFFGQPFRVLKVDRTLVDYYTRLSDFHAQFRAVGTNYNQVVKEELSGALAPGAELQLGEQRYPVTAVGDVAEQNLRELGHITLRFDGHREAEFPGTVHVAGPVPEGIATGCVLKFVA